MTTTKPKSELSFKDAAHTYWDGEQRCISVTDLLELNGLAKDLSFLKLDPLYRYKGTAVHAIFGAIDRGESWRETWGHEDLIPYAAQVEAFKRDTGFQGHIWELPMISRKHRIGGTLDGLGEYGSEIWLVDVKTGVIQECSVACQLNGYKDLLLNGGEIIESCPDLDIDYEWLDFVKRHADRIRLKSLNLPTGKPYCLRSHDEPLYASYWRAAVTNLRARKEVGTL